VGVIAGSARWFPAADRHRPTRGRTDHGRIERQPEQGADRGGEGRSATKEGARAWRTVAPAPIRLNFGPAAPRGQGFRTCFPADEAVRKPATGGSRHARFPVDNASRRQSATKPFGARRSGAKRGRSSVGRARRLHRRGRGFESHRLHHQIRALTATASAGMTHPPERRPGSPAPKLRGQIRPRAAYAAPHSTGPEICNSITKVDLGVVRYDDFCNSSLPAVLGLCNSEPRLRPGLNTCRVCGGYRCPA
jgi:hypothetical protein